MLEKQKDYRMNKGFRFERTGSSLLLGSMSELGLLEEQIPVYGGSFRIISKEKYFVNLAGLYSELR